MSLRVWLPLNGDLKNQGLDDVTVTNNGATIDNNGKIGKCYYFNGSSYIQISLPSNFTTIKNKTVAAWVKSASSTLALGGISNNTSYVDGMITLYTSGWQFGNKNGNNYKYISSGTIANTNVWHHVCCTCDDTTIITYLDGTKVTSNTYTGLSVTSFSLGSNNFIEIGCDHPGGDEFLTGYVNDFRIYDHALSPKEVKLLAQGLVCHYPLNNNGWGNDNLLLNTHFDSRYTQLTGWDTSKNGTLLADSWNGYNAGVTNQATVYHAHLKEFNNEYVYEFIKTSNESWLGINQNSLQTRLTAGKTYTFSWEEYHIDGTNRVGTGLYYVKTGATSANFHLGIQEASDITREIGKWQKYTYTFIAPNDADWSKNMIWYIYGHYNGNGTFYLRHIKLEEGSEATPWCPHPNDTLYTALGLNNNITYDTSGFCNNGTKLNSPTYSDDTARYNISTHLDGINQTIQVPNLLTLIPDSIFTFNVWFKRLEAEPGSKNWETILGGPSGFEIESCSSNTTHDNYIRAYSWGGGTFEFPFNQWNMLTMVSNGTNALFYLNGELKLTGTYKALVSGDYFLGSWKSTTQQNYKGYLSDSRFYCTALSADDILELYNIGASIDNDGNLYAAMIQES